jgi:hypothetical protein
MVLQHYINFIKEEPDFHSETYAASCSVNQLMYRQFVC